MTMAGGQMFRRKEMVMIKLSISTFLMVLRGGSYLITYGMYVDRDVRQWFRVGYYFLTA